ncbi:hypothetical protein LX73_0909 [Fodinibius salinus]|uniref:6-bladed beta-propeller protein n=1 Tax=Fodinibius salinus TaxID=860790 RepID=A0A5D3YNT7_9BACT|nr:hypothetical protein [Fodinibius salinus]TYP95600.1 hypothetical protein LX73_0909 [Fodinibius salinus]
MAAFALRVLFIVLFPSIVLAQSISLSITAATSNNNGNTFLVDGNKVTIKSDRLRFSSSGKTITDFLDVDVSADESIVSVLQQSGDDGTISVYDAKGKLLTTYSSTVTLGTSDPSKAIYSANNGHVLLRDNITRFSFYDIFGNVAASMSSSSQSKQGEKISQVVTSQDQSGTVIYNPKIKRNGKLASRAQSKRADNNFEQIFYSQDRYLKDVTISDNGDLIVLITGKSGAQDKAVIMDLYGNVLNSISVDDNLKGGSFSSDYGFITLYSSSRVMVYSLLDGDRLGSTSLDGKVFLADYFPEDDLILAFTGNYSAGSGMLDNPSFEAINLKKRSIVSKELSGSVGFTKALTPKLIRISDDSYELKNGSNEIRIETDF